MTINRFIAKCDRRPISINRRLQALARLQVHSDTLDNARQIQRRLSSALAIQHACIWGQKVRYTMYIQHDYDQHGNVIAVTAYNDYLNEYRQVDLFKAYFNKKMQEWYILPQYAFETY